jgi:hypothetical protein
MPIRYRPPRTLEDTFSLERSKYIDAKINAALGLCAEPRHPLDNPDAIARARRERPPTGAFHQFSVRERHRFAVTESNRKEEIKRLTRHVNTKIQ